MSDPVMSPDGKFMWSGSEWLPSPPQPIANLTDSVVSGEIAGGDIDKSITNIYSSSSKSECPNCRTVGEFPIYVCKNMGCNNSFCDHCKTPYGDICQRCSNEQDLIKQGKEKNRLADIKAKEDAIDKGKKDTETVGFSLMLVGLLGMVLAWIFWDSDVGPFIPYFGAAAANWCCGFFLILLIGWSIWASTAPPPPEYYCADCGNFLGIGKERSLCSCGCNRYTTEDPGVGRTVKNR